MAWPREGDDGPGSRRTVAGGLVGLVVVSTVLSAVHSGATPEELVALALVGGVVGTGLAVAIGVWP